VPVMLVRAMLAVLTSTADGCSTAAAFPSKLISSCCLWAPESGDVLLLLLLLLCCCCWQHYCR
jgi:hypothetical protein